MPDSKDKPNVEKRSISKEAINDLPMICWDGEVCVLDSLEAMQSCVSKLLNESHLGFDTETRPSFKKGEYYPPHWYNLRVKTASISFAFARLTQLPRYYQFLNPQKY